MSRAEEIRRNLQDVEARVEAACRRAGRERDSIRLIAVSKTFPAEDVEHAIAAGAAGIGENRVQEAREKRPAVSSGARWHLIGHLQSNKVNEAVRLFDVIQTVDSSALAMRIARSAETSGKIQEILIQVNIGGESQKSGVDPSAVEALVAELRDVPSVRVTGLMAIPPVGEPEEMRVWFRQLRELRDRLGLEELSMGMTDDFEVAIEEGATIIRVGRAIFGAR